VVRDSKKSDRFYEELKSISNKQVVYGKEWIVSCFLKLNNLNVLIVGGGNVGLEKLSFKSSPNANVEVVAPRFLPELGC
jgi:hypothetical protein